MVTENINIDVRPGGIPIVIHVTQYEAGLRQFVFTPYTSNGTQTIVAGSATLEGTKPDGYAFQQACQMIDGVITYTLQEQLCAVEGRVWSRLVIRDTGGGMIGYTAIVWVVGCAGVKDDAVMSDSDISALRQFLDEFGTIDAYRGALNGALAAVGGPLVAATASEMTDTTKVYVYTGSESGYTEGHWYYWSGSAWTDGGVYQATGINTDKTLTVEDMAADAKVTGDAVTELKNDLAAYEELSIGYGVDRCNQDLVFGDRGQDGIFVESSSQLTTRKIIPVTPSTSYNISVYGAQLTGAIRWYKYSSTNESDFIATGTKTVNADGTVTLPESVIDANTNGIAFRTSQTALAGGSCRVVASDQLEPLYDVISNMLDTIDDRTEKTISSIATETEQIAPDNGVMTRYPVNGYINNDNGTFMAHDRYVCYYFTVPIDTDMWFDNDIATWGQIAVYNGTMFDTASLVTIKSLNRNTLPYVESKLAVASDMTVVVCVLATGSFRLHYYDIRITPEQIKSIVKPPIRIVPTSATAFSVYVLCETSGEYLRHDFNRITYTDNLTYGDGQTKSLVTCDIWYASNIYDTDGNMIMQGNTNFIQSLNIEGHTGHVGAGHGCVVADWTLFFADGQQFDPTTLTETIECTAFRFTEKATHYLRDTATSPSSAHSYPTLDDNGNPIPVSIEYLDGEWIKNNRVRIHNRLDIVYQTPFKFVQAHAGMCCGFYPYFNNIIFNNGEYLWNEFTRNSDNTYSVSNPGGTATLLPLGSTASIGGDRVIMFGDKYRVTKAITLLNPNRYGKSNMLINTPPNADDRIKTYLMPCICTQSSAMISSGQAVETFTDGDRLETFVDMQLDAVG